jgi:hypothetical protein
VDILGLLWEAAAIPAQDEAALGQPYYITLEHADVEMMPDDAKLS